MIVLAPVQRQASALAGLGNIERSGPRCDGREPLTIPRLPDAALTPSCCQRRFMTARSAKEEVPAGFGAIAGAMQKNDTMTHADEPRSCAATTTRHVKPLWLRRRNEQAAADDRGRGQ